MLKRLKTVSMMLFLMGASTGAAFATSPAGVDDVKITQQSETATGTVLDELGEGVIGASVVVKGTTNGVVTDIDGNFSLQNVKKGDVLQVSFVGYATQEVKWNGTPLTITLKEDTEMLEEVVVVGYGTQKKTNLTGSVSMVDSKALEARPVANVSQALQGVVPGLNMSVTGSGGQLDSEMSMNIRGTGNLGTGSSASPLVLIDGIEGNMNTVNPNDIASISVLKDAASASIYGARAAFGVIMITTKSGKEGKTNVNYSGNVRFSSPTNLPEMMDSYMFAQFFNKAATNSGGQPVFADRIMENIKAYQEGRIDVSTEVNPGSNRWNKYSGSWANTDWFDVMFKDQAVSHEHNLSVSGGTEKLNYRVSGSFLAQDGLIAWGEDKLNRYTVDAKINAKLADWITLNYATKWTREDYDRPTYMSGLMIHNIARRWPTCPLYDPNGYLMDEMEVISLQDGGIRNQQKNYYTQQVGFVLEPIKDWRIHLEGNMRSYNRSIHQEILPVYTHDGDGNAYLTIWDHGVNSWQNGRNQVAERRDREDYFTTNIYTDYSKTINDHYFKVMAGFNAELTKQDWIEGSAEGMIDPSKPWLSQTTTQKKATGGRDHTSLAGFFGRINYTYKDRYMIELNGRYDGSSRFIGDKQWGFFPSTSLGWNIAREEFFQDWNWGAENISTLKLRGSWGQLGNSNTNSWYPFFQTMSTSVASSNWLINGQKQNLASMPGIVSNALTWETVETFDIGLDWALFNNRLTGSFDWFTRYTYDMVGPAPTLPNILGTGAPRINNTDMKSVGWDLEIGWKDRIGEVGYGVKLVLSDATQTILKYPNETKSINDWYEGEKLNNIWGYTTAGLAQSQEEMDAWLAKNKPSWGSNWAAGDVKYVDLNGDGQVNKGSQLLGDTGDYSIIGNSTPRYNFGINLNANWKGIDLSMFWQGTAKRDYWLSGPYFWGVQGGQWQSAGFVEHWDFWRAEDDPLGANTDAYFPRALFGGSDKNQQTSTGYLQDASYIRLKNIQLGYTLPANLVKKAGMSSVRVYVSADNLLTISDITGMFDPEALYDGSGYGGNGKMYPLQKTISVGLNVNF